MFVTRTPVLRQSVFEGPFNEILDPSTMDLSRGQLPVLMNHDNSTSSTIGVTEKIWIQDNQGRALIRFSQDLEADKVFSKIREGILKGISVGYRVNGYKEITQKQDNIRTLQATSFTPFEISVVAIPADPNSQIRSNQTKNYEVEISTEQGNQMLTAQQEKQRQLQIRNAVRNAKLPETYADDLIERDLSSEAARSEILEKLTENQSQPINQAIRVEIGSTNDEKRKECLSDALLHRMDSKNFKVTDNGKHLFGRSLIQQVESVIPRNLMESDVAYAKRAMSSSDLPYILANVAEKSMQRAYGLAPKSYTQWTSNQTVRNYKEASFHALSDFPSLQSRAEGAEFTFGSVSEKREVAQVSDYGKIVSFSSQMIVNDDLGSLQKLASGGGLAASRLDNVLAYSALTTNKTMKDGVVLYHSDHGNLAASGAAISDTTIELAFKAIMAQKSVGDLDNLNLLPKFLICGPDKMVEAKKALAAINAVTTSTVNVWSGSLDLIVDSELTGNQYYFACDPNVIDTVAMIRLEGAESPTVESRIDFMTNSLQLKVAYAVAAAPLDWRGLYKNAGN